MQHFDLESYTCLNTMPILSNVSQPLVRGEAERRAVLTTRSHAQIEPLQLCIPSRGAETVCCRDAHFNDGVEVLVHAALSSSSPRKAPQGSCKNAAFMAANPSFALKTNSSHHWFRNQLETAINHTPVNWLKAQSPFSSGEPGIARVT